MSVAPTSPLLNVKDLRISFARSGGGWMRKRPPFAAVNGVAFHINRGEALGLVGESGCGKTSVGRAVLRLIPAASGSIVFDGRDVLSLNRAQMQSVRRQMQIIFQDPGGSLNARMKVGEIVGEPLLVHRIARGSALRTKVAQLLERCGLWSGAAERYPHEFSGGQRQRIAIARALALQPKLIVCDEPTSALDVSVQATILNLLKDLQESLGLSYLFISHDLAVVNQICDRIAVMHQGRIVEQGERSAILQSPQHAYTRALLASVPQVDAAIA